MNLRKSQLLRPREVILALGMATLILAIVHGGLGYQSITALKLVSALALSILTITCVILSGVLSRREIYVAALICATMLPAIITESFQTQSFKGVTFLAGNLLFFLFFSRILSESGKYLNVVIYSLAAMGVLSSIFAFAISYHPIEVFGVQFGQEGYHRLVGLFSTPNRFAEAAAIGAIALIYIWHIKTVSAFFTLALLIPCIVALLLAGSKGVYLAFFISLIPLVFLFPNNHGYRFYLRAFFFFSLVGFLAWAYSDEIVIATKFDRITQGRTTFGSGRFDIWVQSIESFRSSEMFFKAFGHGVGKHYEQIGANAHSLYIFMLYELGVVSFFLLSVLLAYLTRCSGMKQSGVTSLAWSLILFALVRGFSMPTIFNGINISSIGFWFAASILISRRKAG